MPEPLRGVLMICLGWGAFGLCHSLLCRAWVKRRVERFFGPPFLAGLYRPFYAFLSSAYLLWLWFFSTDLDGDLFFYSLPGGLAIFPITAKTAATVLIALSFREINFSEFTGVGPFFRWAKGDLGGNPLTPLALTPLDEAPMTHRQEPFACRGIYLWVRHPLNTAAFVWIWTQENYTLYNIVFAACLTAYILIANRFEENDLIARYGPAYERYRRIVPAFFSGFSGLQGRAEKLQPLS